MKERLVYSLAITHKEIRYATRVDPVLSSALEFVKQGWAQHVEDLRLQPFFNRRLKLSVEQDCLLWGPRVIKPTVLGRLVGRVAHRSPRHCTDEGNGSYLLMVAEH